jgi:DedD protein
MAEIVVTQDELALRRRARRRLVGAVAIALTCVVALPMLFDSEPKPLGPEVDIRIPAQDTPFEAAPAIVPPKTPAIAPPVQPAPEPKPAEPTLPAPPSVSHLPAPLSVKSETVSASDKAKSAPELAKPALAAMETDKAKPDKKLPAVAASQTASNASADNTKPKLEPKPLLKPDTPFAAQGYFLQLGAFGSETNARLLQEKASAAGFKAAMVGANGQFRIRVGPIPQHDKALEMQTKLKAKGFSPVLLGP